METTLETVILVGILGYVLGQFVLTYKLTKMVRDFSDKNGVILKISTPIVKKLYSETIENIIYIWDHESKDFVCQAKTLEECADLSYKYSNIQYASVKHNESILMFINGKVQDKL